MRDFFDIDWREIPTMIAVVGVGISAVYSWASRRFVTQESAANWRAEAERRVTVLEGDTRSLHQRIDDLPSRADLEKLHGEIKVVTATLNHIKEWADRNDGYIREAAKK